MANFDLEEQEQLEDLKHFWKQYGNLITWVLIAALGTFAAFNGWQYWQRSQALQASVLYDEVESGGRWRHRPGGTGVQGHPGQVRPHRVRAAGRPAGRQGAGGQGQARRRQGRPAVGGGQRRRRG